MLEQKGRLLTYIAILQVVAWFLDRIQTNADICGAYDNLNNIKDSDKSLLIPSNEHETLVFVWSFH